MAEKLFAVIASDDIADDTGVINSSEVCVGSEDECLALYSNYLTEGDFASVYLVQIIERAESTYDVKKYATVES